MTLKPGEKSGNNGGIYVEVGPRGGIKDNFATIAETKPRHQRNALKATGVLAKRTPNSKRKSEHLAPRQLAPTDHSTPGALPPGKHCARCSVRKSMQILIRSELDERRVYTAQIFAS
ncbi:putative cytoplasmic protein [Salmonella enterica subsp. enterica]|nr:putative cytoplasmic protein [Salmonella enterica subsp. enterica] [Salmonella enterica subsp. enterica serovar Menston]